MRALKPGTKRWNNSKHRYKIGTEELILAIDAYKEHYRVMVRVENKKTTTDQHKPEPEKSKPCEQGQMPAKHKIIMTAFKTQRVV